MTDPTPTPDRLSSITRIDGLPDPDYLNEQTVVEVFGGVIMVTSLINGIVDQSLAAHLDAAGWRALRDAAQRQLDAMGGLI